MESSPKNVQQILVFRTSGGGSVTRPWSAASIIYFTEYNNVFVPSSPWLNIAEVCSWLWNLMNMCSFRRLIIGVCMDTDY